MNTSPPRVSVVMPVRNAGRYLAPAVDSVLSQTMDDLELLLIDDHSHDGAIDTLPDDPRLRILRHNGDGIVDSLNLGIIKARGQFIARMDADDISTPERLALQLAYADAHPQTGIISGRVEMFNEDDDVGQGNLHYVAWLNSLKDNADISRDIFIESPLCHPSVLIRRDVFKQTGLYRDLSWPEDYDLWLRAWLKAIPMGKVDELVLLWREHQARLTRTDTRYSPKEFIKLKAWAMSESVLRNRPAMICGTGKLALKLCDVLLSLGVEVKAFVDIAPHKIGRLKRDRPVIGLSEVTAERGDALLVGAVGARGAGERLRAMLLEAGLHEPDDFILAG
ncbi:glycosyltransferase [Granulosicoccaceae sp. 1_MG-2023]|nr:glycosyltransferase [Granulosicoccaceae sp. 1_MG-2023]